MFLYLVAVKVSSGVCVSNMYLPKREFGKEPEVSSETQASKASLLLAGSASLGIQL
jgi:hypothetical protein